MILYKYQGAGNDFLIADNRDGSNNMSTETIIQLCDRRYGIGADGVMLLENAPEGYGFSMVFYNPDGTGGMMCGNGGRCIVAFAAECGIQNFNFLAPDGPHSASILGREGKTSFVCLKMRDVDEMTAHPEVFGTFLDTGTRHLVVEVSNLDNYNVEEIGARLRRLPQFGPIGVNVNFVEMIDGMLHVRTFEKGVEGETYACGTGITAAAIAYWHAKHPSVLDAKGESVTIPIRARRDDLSVKFIPTPSGAKDVYLSGPAAYIARIEI